MAFSMKIKFDGKLLQKAKSEKIEDLEDILTGLKDKFGNNKKKK